MENQSYKKQIENMLDMDQKLRFQGFAENKNLPKGTYTIWNYMVYVMDKTHGLNLHRLINEFGFPTIETVGKEGMEKFSILVLHQDEDPSLQEKVLKECKFDAEATAHLIDRVHVNKGEPQEYGTQVLFSFSEEEINIFNKNREFIGLNKLT